MDFINSGNIDEVSDPSDWENSKFPQLGILDSSLRCQICKDFLNAPVLTTCGHIFCSICIRRTISVSNKCPLCLEETYESGLRKVLLLDNIVKWFIGNRSDLFKNLPVDEIKDSQCDSSSDICMPSDDSNHPDSSFKDETKSEDNLAECPICGVFMPLEEIQGKHLDRCLQAPAKKSRSQENSPKTRKSFWNGSKSDTKYEPVLENRNTERKLNIQMQPDSVKKKHRMANLDTSLSTAKLRSKMQQLNIPTNGTRAELEHRMKEFINLYNANLDSISPLSDRVLVSKLKKWESLITQKHSSNTEFNNTVNSSPPITYDEQTIKRQKLEHKSWNAKNKSQYADLIKMAKVNMQKQRSRNKMNAEEKNVDGSVSGVKVTGVNEDDELSDIDTELIQ